nr:hypothetical protein OG781_35040 [Streptomyces sp. NBC_00830]
MDPVLDSPPSDYLRFELWGTPHNRGWPLRCPPVERYMDGYGWLEKPDGAGKLTSPIVLGAAFGPGGGLRLPAQAFC